VGCFDLQIIHPIHDQTFFLNAEHKRQLKEEYGETLESFVEFVLSKVHNFQDHTFVVVVINFPLNAWNRWQSDVYSAC